MSQAHDLTQQAFEAATTLASQIRNAADRQRAEQACVHLQDAAALLEGLSPIDMEEHNWGDADERCHNDCGLYRRARTSAKGTQYWVYTYQDVVLSFRQDFEPPGCEAMRHLYDEDKGYNVLPYLK